MKIVRDCPTNFRLEINRTQGARIEEFDMGNLIFKMGKILEMIR